MLRSQRRALCKFLGRYGLGAQFSHQLLGRCGGKHGVGAFLVCKNTHEVLEGADLVIGMIEAECDDDVRRNRAANADDQIGALQHLMGSNGTGAAGRAMAIKGASVCSASA